LRAGLEVRARADILRSRNIVAQGEGVSRMAPGLKFAIGLGAALLAGWLHHGPMGGGARFIDGLEAEAQRRVEAAAVPGVTVALARDPLARSALLAGPADRFQRDGIGSLPGLTERIESIEGIGRVEWVNPPPEER
jgi:hypothetical protein